MIKNGKKWQKSFDKWNLVKKELEDAGGFPNISDGEVWWCAMGENIGVEVSGKGKRFLRPILVVRKINKHEFIGIPLTTKQRMGSWYVQFFFNGQSEVASLIQVRAMSVRRLIYKMGEVPESDLELVKRAFLRLFETG